MKRFIYLFFLICAILGTSFQMGPNGMEPETQTENLESINMALNAKTELTNEVDNYIKTVAPTSLVNADYLVDGCNSYGIDLIFVLAQGTLESHFATKGVGGKINSIFNVCVYDNIKTGSGVAKNYRYPHPDDSIEPYLQLLRDSYLVNGKTEDDLLVNYVNKHGQRYATYPHYEKQMASIMKRIKTTTKIDSLQTVYSSMETIIL
jgi:flagellum-specific peptidoglycan hydrolase FlgJ